MIRYAITNDVMKYAIKNDYAITNDVIIKKINNIFVFQNTPAQLTLDDTCLLRALLELSLLIVWFIYRKLPYSNNLLSLMFSILQPNKLCHESCSYPPLSPPLWISVFRRKIIFENLILGCWDIKQKSSLPFLDTLYNSKLKLFSSGQLASSA